MRFALEPVQNAQISLQLSKIGCLELPGLQFHRYQAVQLTIEKQKVNILIFPEGIQVILVANEGEVLTES